jgi:hypothetical protein
MHSMIEGAKLRAGVHIYLLQAAAITKPVTATAVHDDDMTDNKVHSATVVQYMNGN